MQTHVKVLDHGYVELIPKGCWGSEEIIIDSARMSTAKGFLGWGPLQCAECLGAGERNAGFGVQKCENCKGTGQLPGDEKLLAYLWNHRHTTPFEMAGMTFEIMAPIFVFREWHRHRTQSYNEMSARYIPLPDVNYLPTIERCFHDPKGNRQASAAQDVGELTQSDVHSWLDELQSKTAALQECYERGVTIGIPKEIARGATTVFRYSRMRASANLLNWLRFIGLRMDPHAQWEIQQYAESIFALGGQLFPKVMDLFQNKRI